MSKSEIILMDSPEAARLVTVTGWASRDGRFFGKDEEAARYSGATHRRCSSEGCEGITEKYKMRCLSHEFAVTRERYEAKELVEYDGESLLNEFGTDRYFNDEQEVREYCIENAFEIGDMMLVVCVPNRPPLLDVGDYLYDYMPEDFSDDDLNPELVAAANAFNTVLEKMKPPSWVAGQQRVQFPPFGPCKHCDHTFKQHWPLPPICTDSAGVESECECDGYEEKEAENSPTS